jgi:hypothetical protein
LNHLDRDLKEIQSLRGRFKMNEKFHLVEPLKIEKGKKVPISSVLKGATYCQDPMKDREKLKEVYKMFDTLDDYRMDLVMSAVALQILETRNIHTHGLEIFVAKGDDLGSLLSRCENLNIVGEMNHTFNVLFMSKADNPKNFNLVFSHEIIHKLERDVTGSVPSEEFERAVEETKKRILLLDKQDETYQFLDHVFQRLKKHQHLYPKKSQLMEEYFADISKMMMYYQYEPQTKEPIQKAIKPMLDVFDQHFIPKLEQLLLKNKNRNLIELPNSVSSRMEILAEKMKKDQSNSCCFGLSKSLRAIIPFNR